MNTPKQTSSLARQDRELLSELTRTEHAETTADLNTRGWKPAVANSQNRLSQLSGLIASTSSTLACKSGCWYCCHFLVEARAEEVLQIADYVNSRFTKEQVQQLRERLANNAAILRQMSREQQLSANLACAFLQDGKCSVYNLRPMRCRSFHATDVTGCKQAYEQPGNLDIKSSLLPQLLYTAEAHIKGSRQAFEQAGYDNTTYELNAAMELALTDSTPKRQFEKREPAFVNKAD
jgi:Fe-S-cluster containining protein